ncbi:MAG TPA: DUF1902 domain-containing protein [Treponemataceae bacterium]|nr:DUF1902 domain-containing protein [Treponemataceae bacterium]
MEYTIQTVWDEDAGVWIATSDSIPGLVLESGSLDVLMERVRHAVPELFALNNIHQEVISLFFRSERHYKVYA